MSGSAKKSPYFCLFVGIIIIWLEANLLKLNDSKREFMVLVSRHTEPKRDEGFRSIKVGEAEVKEVSTACNIGVIMDSRLNMEVHV